jgi:hypothetical protein
VLPQISEYGGDVMQTSLDDEGEARLREVLESGAPAATGTSGAESSVDTGSTASEPGAPPASAPTA